MFDIQTLSLALHRAAVRAEETFQAVKRWPATQAQWDAFGRAEGRKRRIERVLIARMRNAETGQRPH